MAQLQILIADDSEFMRIAYKRILESQSNFRVVAMASNGEEAVQKAAESTPDVAILDIRMPKVDGIKVAHELLKRRPNTGIVIISAYDDLSFVADLMQGGSQRKAYLLKNSLSDISELIRIVEAVYQGHTVLDSGIVHKMARLYCKHSELLQTTMTDSEQDLLGLMAEGYDDAYICRALHMGQDQVEDNAESIYRKFGIDQSTTQTRRIKAIQAFVEQINKIPLTVAGDLVD
ncbi:MAG: response regulator transcription factor [Chloroflexi bacterium]|nr:response regulator transcription factor [Chloroflexota bacterium]